MKSFFYVLIISLYVSASYAQSSGEVSRCPRLYFELNTCIQCLKDNDPIDEILVIGNSITKHGKYEAIGWLFDWGMAASKESHDWVHLLADNLSKDQGVDVKLNILNNVDLPWIDREWKRIKKAILNKNNKIIFIQIGDNALGLSFDDFERPYRKLLDYAKEKSAAKIVLLSTWRFSSLHRGADLKISKLADEYSYPYIKISHLYKDELNQAKGEKICEAKGINPHICWHPGDIGMAAIAFEVCNQGHAAKYDGESAELTLEDMLVGNTHYSVKLKNEEGLFRILDINVLETSGYDSHSSSYDVKTGMATIPNVSAFHGYYSVTLSQHMKNSELFFSLDVLE
jgi:hypothetical protein